MDRVAFYNNGPDQLPGLIVMNLSDEMDPDLDPAREQIVVLVNANDAAQTFSDADFVGLDLALMLDPGQRRRCAGQDLVL